MHTRMVSIADLFHYNKATRDLYLIIFHSYIMIG